MLKHIPDILSPQLLKIMQEMGHGDRICIGDGNFPVDSMAGVNNARIVDLSGHGTCEILEAMLKFIPLDDFVKESVLIMEHPADEACPIQDEYRKIVAKYDARGADTIKALERFAYYEEAKKCYAILRTGETATWANIILQKGVVYHGDDGI